VAAFALPYNNLPSEVSSFIGRSAELDDIRRRLGSTRLLTLLGPGGIGKTRLALRVAEIEAGNYPDGVLLVELAALVDHHLVPQVVSDALATEPRAANPSSTDLVEQLRGRSLLLVLDNCEHVLDGVSALLDALLRACPGLRVLATSRQSLGVAGEAAWRVPSLPLPHPEEGSTERLARNDAAALFIERAAATSPTFKLTERNVRAIAQICVRLDGLPLALELAAARVRVLSPEQIAERLDDHFRLLTGGARTAPARQQTLRGALDWSFGLLSAHERTVFGRLAVFAGGWTLESAEIVCSDKTIARDLVLDLIDQLVDKSLVTAEVDATEVRYGYLQPVHAYALGVLRGSGESDNVRLQHVHAVTALVRETGVAWERDHQPTWIDRLQRELDNIRSALNWCDQSGEIELGLQLVDAAWFFWNIRGHLNEWREMVEHLLGRAENIDQTVLAQGLLAAGYLATAQGDFAAARGFDERNLELARAMRDQPRAASALRRLGLDALAAGLPEEAVQKLEESVALSRAVGSTRDARLALYVLGHAYRAAGDLNAAADAFQGALAAMRTAGDGWHSAHVWIGLGLLAAQRGAVAEAAACLQTALDGFDTFGDRRVVASALDAQALLECELGHPQRAARLLGSAEGQRRMVGAAPEPFLRHDLQRASARAHAAIGEDAYRQEFDSGVHMSLSEALVYARTRTVRHPASPLTPREREVASLVARGLSNRQLAEALVISEQTAETHVKRILSKLGFTSRAQVSRWQDATEA
jgi:predicted ATPase/DNA-binding CsgD family transcriptional regulator